MCSDLTKEQICKELFNYGVSKDYNKPATLEELKRMNEDKLRLCFNCIQWTNNLVDISRVKGSDLNIQNDGYDYIMTYSFPCQDLSVAGNRKGMGEGTRSGLLWQVERILTECKELEAKGKGYMPNVLILENVIQVHSQADLPHFRKWMQRLEELGYQNYWQDLIATDYGIPQTRNRCFMVSILGDYSYTFPKPMKLKLRLKDLLEKNVKEEYFISDKQLDDFLINEHLRETLESREEIKENSFIDAYNRNIRDDDLSGCIHTRINAGNDTFLAIKNNNAKGYLEAQEGDGVDISGRMQYHRGTVQKGMAQTLNTNQDGGVVVKANNEMLKKELCNKLIQDGKVKENDVIRHNYTNSKDGNCIQNNNEAPTLDTRPDCLGVVVLGNCQKSNHEASRIIDKNGLAPTIKENHGTINAIEESELLGGIGEKDSNSGTQWKQQNRIYSSEKSGISLGTGFNPFYNQDLRIRKLTERECGRLQGVKDENITLMLEHQSKALAYHLFGDSIVVNVLMAIFSTMLDKQWQNYFDPFIWWGNDIKPLEDLKEALKKPVIRKDKEEREINI